MRREALLLLVPLWLGADTIVKEIDSALNTLRIESAKKVSEQVHIHYDPFRVAARKAEKRPIVQHTSHPARKLLTHRPTLSMILNQSAFIDGRWVKEKMKIAGYRVVAIGKDRVVLARRGKRLVLRLPENRCCLVTKEER